MMLQLRVYRARGSILVRATCQSLPGHRTEPPTRWPRPLTTQLAASSQAPIPGTPALPGTDRVRIAPGTNRLGPD